MLSLRGIWLTVNAGHKSPSVLRPASVVWCDSVFQKHRYECRTNYVHVFVFFFMFPSWGVCVCVVFWLWKSEQRLRLQLNGKHVSLCHCIRCNFTSRPKKRLMNGSAANCSINTCTYGEKMQSWCSGCDVPIWEVMAIKSVFFWIVNSLKLTITHQDAVVLPFTLIKVSVPDVHGETWAVCFLLGPISHQTNSGKQKYRSDEH